MSPTTTLARLPIDRLTEWCGLLVRAPESVRRDALAEADALREASDAGDDSWRCLSAYRTLVELALAGPRAGERASWMVREDPGRDATTRRFAEAAVDSVVDASGNASGNASADARSRAVVVLAECDTHAGLDRAAERRLRELWPRVRGTNTAAEVWTSCALAELFTVQRRELEALAIARRGEAAAERAAGLEPVDVAHVRSAVARALFALGDTARLLAHLPKFLAAADALDATDAGRARYHAHLLVARCAVNGGECELARWHLALAEDKHARDPGVVGHRGDAILHVRAQLAREERDALGLRRALDAMPKSPPAEPVRAVARAGLEAAASGLAGDVAALTSRTNACLALLGVEVEGGVRGLTASVRLFEAESLARIGEACGLPTEIVDAALRVAADGAFERMVEIEQAARDLPSLGTPTDDDLQALGEYRARFVRRHVLVLTRLRARIEAAAREGTLSSWAQRGEAGLTTVCAWCLSVRDVDGGWLPLGHLLPSTPALPVTHGICARCRAVASAALAAQ